MDSYQKKYITAMHFFKSFGTGITKFWWSFSVEGTEASNVLFSGTCNENELFFVSFLTSWDRGTSCINWSRFRLVNGFRRLIWSSNFEKYRINNAGSQKLCGAFGRRKGCYKNFAEFFVKHKSFPEFFIDGNLRIDLNWKLYSTDWKKNDMRGKAEKERRNSESKKK